MAAGIRVGDEPPSRAARELRASPVSTVDDGRKVFAPRQRNEEEIGRWHHCTLAKRGDASGGAGRGNSSPEIPALGRPPPQPVRRPTLGQVFAPPWKHPSHDTT